MRLHLVILYRRFLTLQSGILTPRNMGPVLAPVRHLLDPMTTDNNPGNAINGIFMLASFMVLFTLILFLLVIYVYVGFCCRKYWGISLSGRTNISWHHGFSFAHGDPLSLRNVGLNMRVIESLPIFKYKAQSFKDALKCTVCVSEFEENEKS